MFKKFNSLSLWSFKDSQNADAELKFGTTAFRVLAINTVTAIAKGQGHGSELRLVYLEYILYLATEFILHLVITPLL